MYLKIFTGEEELEKTMGISSPCPVQTSDGRHKLTWESPIPCMVTRGTAQRNIALRWLSKALVL